MVTSKKRRFGIILLLPIASVTSHFSPAVMSHLCILFPGTSLQVVKRVKSGEGNAGRTPNKKPPSTDVPSRSDLTRHFSHATTGEEGQLPLLELENWMPTSCRRCLSPPAVTVTGVGCPVTPSGALRQVGLYLQVLQEADLFLRSLLHDVFMQAWKQMRSGGARAPLARNSTRPP